MVPRQNDDGTIAPTGAGGSLIFTPHESLVALRYIKENYGYGLWGKYGFKDAFNQDIDWFSPTYIGIDQGAILTMTENYRSGLVQSLFMQNGCAKLAMQNAGFTDADTTPPTLRTEFKTYETPVPEEKEVTLPPEAPRDSLLVDRFDDCISRYGAGAWHGGSSTPEDCVIMFDSSVNRGETGCSMKIRYNVEKKGSYNGAWIKLGNLDLIQYNELVFWVKSDEKEGYTTTFKIELKSSNGQVEYVAKGVTSSWGRTAIPLNEFITPAWASEIDWGDVNELTLVFEDWRATDKDGVVYIDDIYFTPATSKPTPIPTLSPTPTPPGFEIIFAIAGLLTVAYLLREVME
jgi:hypothetical protein